MRARFKQALYAALLLECTAAVQAQNLIVNGSFETPILAEGANYDVPANELLPWLTTEGAFSIWVPVLPNELAVDGRQHVEVVSIWQTVPTVPGEDYRLEFYHSPRPGVDSELSVQLNDQTMRIFVENGTALAGFTWQRFRTNFTAMSDATTIRFNGVGVAGNAHIDDVVLERLPVRATFRVTEVEVCWETVTDKTYQVQYRSELTTNDWVALGSPRSGTGTSDCFRDMAPSDEPQRFYRIITVP